MEIALPGPLGRLSGLLAPAGGSPYFTVTLYSQSHIKKSLLFRLWLDLKNTYYKIQQSL